MSEHYFSQEPGAPDERSQVQARIWGRDYTFTTSRGVFSPGRLDKATEVLLRRSDPPVEACTVLDLGCGWGPLACAIAVECPETTVYAVDANERALDLVRRNAERLGVADRVEAMLSADVPDDVRYDAIWSNPPVRTGKAALHELMLGWLPRLADGGSSRLVVGKNLGADSLQRWLVDQGWRCERVASAKGFRVLVVSGS